MPFEREHPFNVAVDGASSKLAAEATMPATPRAAAKRSIRKPRLTHEPRVQRRKREARARLIDAAMQLMAERGADGVAIHEITEAADVATGGFYNHFKSKEDIYLAVTNLVFEDFADALDAQLAGIEDPAEVIAVSIRQTLRRARREPVWGKLLVREGLSAQAANRGLGVRLRRDIERGTESGRFKPSDALLAFLAIGGAVLAAVATQLHAPKALPDLPERVAAMALQFLGLTPNQSDRVARKTLPVAELTHA